MRMSKSYHVSITDEHGRNRQVCKSHDSYEAARDHAVAVHARADGGQAVEITNSGATVWGPYVVGGKFKP